MATKKVEPTQTELSINYSVGVKANIGNYESSDAHVSRSEKWNVEGMSDEEIDVFWHTRYQTLHDSLGELIESEYMEMLGKS